MFCSWLGAVDVYPVAVEAFVPGYSRNKIVSPGLKVVLEEGQRSWKGRPVPTSWQLSGGPLEGGEGGGKGGFL